MISASIFVARYKESFDTAKAAFQCIKLEQELGVCTSLKPKQAVFKKMAADIFPQRSVPKIGQNSAVGKYKSR